MINSTPHPFFETKPLALMLFFLFNMLFYICDTFFSVCDLQTAYMLFDDA